MSADHQLVRHLCNQGGDFGKQPRTVGGFEECSEVPSAPEITAPGGAGGEER